MSEKAKGSFFDRLPPSLIRKNNVTLIPEGAIGYLVGPTLALLANSVLATYFNKYMSDVLHISTWAKGGNRQGLLAIIGAIPTAVGMVIALPLANALGSKAKATELCFTAFHLDELTDKRKRDYCRHELFIMFGISVLFARLNGAEPAEDDLKHLWANCRAYDAKWADTFRWRTLLRAACLPGEGGRRVVRLFYQLAHTVVCFN